MLVCIGVGAVASLLFHLLVKEEIQAPGQQVEYLSRAVSLALSHRSQSYLSLSLEPSQSFLPSSSLGRYSSSRTAGRISLSPFSFSLYSPYLPSYLSIAGTIVPKNS